MDILNELADTRLTDKDLHKKTEFLIDGFLAAESITMVFAQGGEGKSYFSVALAKHLLHIPGKKEVIYFDMDNPLKLLKDRGIDKLINDNPRLNYQHRSKSKNQFNTIRALAEAAYGRCYERYVFFVDSIRDLVDGNMYDESKIRKLMGYFKDIRDAGGTVVLLHHTTKDGRTYQGSQDFRNSLDNSFRLKQVYNGHGELHFLLEIDKERDSVSECGFGVTIEDFGFSRIDREIASLGEHEREFVKKVMKALKDKELKQGEILAELGKARNDREGIRLLQNFTGRFWKHEKVGRIKVYKLTA